MRANDLKDAKVYKVMLDKERTLTFDFNALGVIQECGFDNPFVAIPGIYAGHINAIKIVGYASLVAGQLYEDEDTMLDISMGKFGRILGELMMREHETYKEFVDTLHKATRDFLPESKEDEEKEEKEKN